MDNIAKEKRSANMRAIRSKNTKPELLVRKKLFFLGYRYKLHTKLPGRPDLAFPSSKKLIFIHGCFWHQHADEKCKIKRIPKSSLEYWIPKLDRNVARDKENFKDLQKQGWKILTLWECQIKAGDTVWLPKAKRFLSS